MSELENIMRDLSNLSYRLATNPIGDKTLSRLTYDAKKEIKDLFIELIGEDYKADPLGLPLQQDLEHYARNLEKQELRQKVQSL